MSKDRPAGARPLQVLLVEDDVDDALSVQRHLTAKSGFELVHVRTGSEALQVAAKRPFDVLLLDYRLPDISGIALCKQLRDSGLKSHILLVTSVRDDAAAGRAFAAGASDYLVKTPDYGERLAAEIRARVGVGP